MTAVYAKSNDFTDHVDVQRFSGNKPEETQLIVNAAMPLYDFISIVYTCDNVPVSGVIIGRTDAPQPQALEIPSSKGEDWVAYLESKFNYAVAQGMNPEDLDTLVIITHEEQDGYCAKQRKRHFQPAQFRA